MYWSGVMQAVRIDEMRLPVMPSRCASAFMRSAKACCRAADILADRHGDVVGRLDQHHLQRVVERHDRAGLEAHLARRLGGGMLGNLDRRIERQLAGRDRAERHIGRHQLGERGRIPALESVLMLQHLAAVAGRRASTDWPLPARRARRPQRQPTRNVRAKVLCRIIESEIASCRSLPRQSVRFRSRVAGTTAPTLPNA